MNNSKILLTLVLVSLFSCKSKSTTKQIVVKEEKVSCIPYFDFDKIEHYSIKIEESGIWKIYEKKRKTVDDKRFIELILKYTPEKIEDTTILKEIEKSGYIKRSVQLDKFEMLNSIFCEKKHKNSIALSCIAYYRDIVVFKKENKTVGVAKVCFECSQSIITGTKRNTQEFGQSGDYGRLKKLLYN